MQLYADTIIPECELSFSTLYGSKWVATEPIESGRSWGLMFQYPLRVEVGCNSELCEFDVRISLVSVPSTGRSGLQLNFHRLKSIWVSGFSTLYGSKWVATRVLQLFYSNSFGFSTLYGSKWVATWKSSVRLLNMTSFSTLYGSKWVATLPA